MAISNWCDDPSQLDVEFQDDFEEAAYQYLLEYYNGDHDAAYNKFYQMYRRQDRYKYLRDSIASKVFPEFSPEQQRSVVEMMKKAAVNSLTMNTVQRDGKPKMGIIRDKVFSMFDDAFRTKFEQLGDDYRLQAVDDIIDRFDDLWKMAHNDLEDMGLEIDNDGFVQKTGGIDAERRNWDDNARFFIDPKDTASTRVKLTLAFVPKKEFKRDPNTGKIITDEDGLPQIKNSTNFLGFNEFAPLDDIYDKVGEILSDFVPPSNVEDNTYQAYVDHLKKIGRSNPQILAVTDKLESLEDSPSFQADFVNTFGKSYTKESMILLSPLYKRGKSGNQIGFNLNVIDSNRTSQVQSVKEAWLEDQKRLPIVSQDQEGDLRIDQNEVENIRDNYIENMRNHLNEGGTLSDSEGIKLIRDTLSSLGLTTRFETLEYLSQNPEDLGTGREWRIHVHPDSIEASEKGLLPIIFETFETTRDPDSDEVQQYGKLGLNNPISGRDSQGIVNKLAKAESEHAPRVYSPSFRNVEGNQIHALQDHTSLTREFGRLLDDPESAKSDRGVYDSQSILLDAIENNDSDVRDILDIEYTDGLKRVTRKEGSPYENMSTSEKELVNLSFFQNPQKNGRMKFMAPTLSDKSREYIITLPKIQNFFNEDRWLPVNEPTGISDDGELNLDARGLEGKVLYNLARSEVERIKNVQSLMEDMKPSEHPLGEDYMWEAQFFYTFPELNPSNLGDEVGRLYTEKMINGESVYKLRDTDQSRAFMREKLVEALKERVQNTKDRWIEQDIVRDPNDTSTWLMDRSYLKNTPYGLRDANKKLTYAALDYQLGQNFFNSEITKILAGDPALHVDRQRDENVRTDDPATIDATLDNLQKRLANHIAPAITQNVGVHRNNPDLEDTSEVRIVTLQDRRVDSKHIDQYEKIFRKQLGNEELANAYRDIESTDAQEYTTLREHIRTQLLNGEISKEMHDQIAQKIDDAIDEENNYRNQFSLTEEEREHVLMPHKDIYVGRKHYDDIGLTNWIYRKTSSIPLIPEVTRGTDLDNLRVAMENQGVDRAAYQSADKTGAYNPVDPFDQTDDRKRFKDTGDIEDLFIGDKEVSSSDNELTENDRTVQRVNRRDLGLQFQIPIKDDGVISRVSQMDKNLTQNIKNVDGFDNPFGEGTVDGKELENMKQERISRIWDLGREELLNELDAEATVTEEDGQDAQRTFVFNNIERLQELLQNEAEQRDWSPSAIDSIQIEDDQFVLPLSFSPAASNIESLLLSIIQDRTTGQKMPGKSYVQVSHAGWHGIADQSSVYTTQNFDKEAGLKHARIEDGEVKPAQVMITWDFKDEDGNLLDIRNYTDEDGRIDDNKLDPELRKRIGARIPNQGASSQLPVEVVGFLPPNQAKTIVVTDEIVTQMGSDFDVDKVYTYADEYALEEDESLRRASTNDDGFTEIDELKQEYKDIHWSALTNPDTLARILKPLDMEYLGNEADNIQNMRDPTDEVSKFIDPHYQVDSHNSQHAGKKLIGITSLASNFNSMLELYPMPVNNASIRSRTEDGNVRRLDQVGGTDNTVQIDEDTEVPISDVIMMFQNGAVDNASELILDKLNATTNTAETIMAAATLNDGDQGLPLYQLTRFFSQEIISKLDEQIDRLQGQTNEEYLEEDVIDVATGRITEDVLSNFSDTDQDWIENQLEDRKKHDQETTEVVFPTVSELTRNLEKSNTDALENDRNYAAQQLKYLQSYRSLNDIAETLVSIRSVVNFGDRASGGPGKSLLHSQSKLDDYQNLDDNRYFHNASDIVASGEWKSAIDNSYKLAWELYNPQGRNLFHYDTSLFRDVKYELEKNQGNKLNPDDALEVFREMRSFIFTSDNMFENVQGERNKLLFGTENVDDIATRVKKAQEGWGRESFFISRLRPQLPDGENDIGTVLFSSDKAERTDDIKIIQDLAGLLVDENPEKRLLAEDLVKYAYLVSGGVQNPTSFSNYIPIAYIKEELGVREAINNFDFENPDSKKAERFKTQYFQHNPTQAKILDREIVDNLRTGGDLPTKIKTKDNREFYRVGSRGDKEAIDFVSMYDTRNEKWRLYKYGNDGNHYEIDTLGKANEDGYNTVEYDLSKDKEIRSSVIESNQTELTGQNPFTDAESKPVEKMEDEMDSLSTLINDGESEINGERYYQSVRDNETDPYVAKLANFMEDIDTDFRVRFAPQSFFQTPTTDGYYNPETNEDIIWISRGMLDRGKDNTQINRTILHELIHKQTTALERKQNLTNEQKNLLGRLNSIFNQTIEKSNPPARLRRAMEDENGEIDFHEFLAYGIANEEGAEWLKSVNLGEDQTALDSLVNVIYDIIKSISESLGMQIDNNSALAYTIKDTLRLFDETRKAKDRTPDDPKSKSKSELAEENETEEADPTDDFEDFMNKVNEAAEQQGNNQDLGQSVGEFRQDLDSDQRKTFDKIRNRINTKC